MSEALITTRALFSMVIVVGLLAAFVWAARRGTLRLSGFQSRTSMTIETAMSLGERRSLAIVRVDGRRLLIGLTPSNVSMLADLPATAPVTAPAGVEGSN